MTELEELRSRRELAILAAKLQRANVATRLDRIEANPVRKAFALATRLAARPATLTLGAALARRLIRNFHN